MVSLTNKENKTATYTQLVCIIIMEYWLWFIQKGSKSIYNEMNITWLSILHIHISERNPRTKFVSNGSYPCFVFVSICILNAWSQQNKTLPFLGTFQNRLHEERPSPHRNHLIQLRIYKFEQSNTLEMFKYLYTIFW